MEKKDIAIGKKIPKLNLDVSPGDSVSLPQDIQGKWTLFYFYPKDDTPGCTKQACAYQSELKKFSKIKVQVFGVSKDSLTSHEKFQKKYGLEFPLLSDKDEKLKAALQVEGRDTFLCDPEGKVVHVWRKVKADQTVGETLEFAQEFIENN